MDLKEIDIFGVEIQLRYLNEGVYKSRYGAIITIIICALVGIQTFLSGQELYLKENPDVIQAEQFISFPERSTLTIDTFNFGLGVQFPVNSTHFIDESIYTVRALMTIMQTKVNTTTNQSYQDWQYIPIDMHPCTKDDFQVKETAERFQDFPFMTNLYCVDYTKQQIYMEGNYDQNSFAYLQIFFELCTGSPKCRPKDEIIKILTNSYVAIYTNDNIVNAKDFVPFQRIQRDFFWSTSPIYTKDVYLYFRNTYVQSDLGLLFEQISAQHQVTFSYLNEQLVFSEDMYFNSVIIRFETSKQSIYHRKYKKLDNVLAEIGGISKALLVAGFILCIPINQLKLHKQLSNSLFTYGKREENENSKHNRIGKTFKQIISTQNQQKMQQKTNNNLSSSRINFKDDDKNIFSLSKLPKDSNDQQPPKSTERSKKGIYGIFQQLNKERVKQSNQNLQNQENKENPITQNLQYQESEQKEDIGTQRVFSIANIKSLLQQKSQNVLEMIKISKQMSTNQATQKGTQQQLNTTVHSEHRKEMIKDQQPSNTIMFSFMDYIKYYAWPWGQIKKKKQQLDYSTEKIYEHLDIQYIVQKLLELEKLKQVLLDEDQIKLIQFFPKPLIDIDEINKEKVETKEEKLTSTQGQNTFTENIDYRQKRIQKKEQINLLKKIMDSKQISKEAYQALKNIMSKDILSQIDFKIIEMIDAQILEQIDKNADYLEKEAEENNFEKEAEENNLEIEEQENNLEIEEEENNLEIEVVKNNLEIEAEDNKEILIIFDDDKQLDDNKISEKNEIELSDVIEKGNDKQNEKKVTIQGQKNNLKSNIDNSDPTQVNDNKENKNINPIPHHLTNNKNQSFVSIQQQSLDLQQQQYQRIHNLQ